MYAIKNEEEDRIFNENGALIKRKKASEIMTSLGIKEKYKLHESANFSSSRLSFNEQNSAKYSATQTKERESISPFN